jgi:hypothetical protein
VSRKLSEKEIHDITLGILSKLNLDYNSTSQLDLLKEVYLKRYFEIFNYVKTNYGEFEK